MSVKAMRIDCFTRRPAQKVLLTLTLLNSGWGGI